MTYSGKGSRFSYGAKELNPENGYFKMGARLYDAKIGRFLSRDPLAELFPNHSSYSYAFNSPLNFNDPTGLAPEPEKGDKLQGGLDPLKLLEMLDFALSLVTIAGLPPGQEASMDQGTRTGILIGNAEFAASNSTLDAIRKLNAAKNQASQERMSQEKAKLQEKERKRGGDDSAMRDFLMEQGRSKTGSDNTRTMTHVNYNPLGAVRDNSPTVGSQSKFSPENLTRNNRSQNVDPSKSDALDAAVSEVTPFDVGWEWLTGTGPRHREFTNGDVFTEMLRKHEHVQETIDIIVQEIADGNLSGQNDYRLDGIQGIPKYLKDYSTLITFGQTGNLAVTYLGSYSLQWEVTNLSSNTATVNFTVVNASTIQSATRPPVIGYTPWWQNSIGGWLNHALSSGAMSRTTQTFKWTETISW